MSNKKKFTLYLDESETHTYNKTLNVNDNYHFCMAGIIIAEDYYTQLECSVNLLKQTIWNEFPNPEKIILHQMLINDAEKGRLNSEKYPEYIKFTKKSERKKLYDEIKKILSDNNITIIGSSINKDKLKKYYSVSGRNKQDESLVTMQLLLENYCHFLCTNDGIGNIVYESRELISNERLRDKYYHMKLMGSMYMSKEAAEKRLLGIDFVTKNDNCAGLQIADFVPLSFARNHAGMLQIKPNIFSTLQYCRYDGRLNQKERFGIKYMP